MSFARVIRCIRFRGTCIVGGCLSLRVLGGTLDRLDSLDSDPGPNLLNRMHLKWPQDFRFRLHQAPSGASDESNAYTEANDSKLGPQGPDFRCIRFIPFGPWPESNGPNESKVPPSEARTF